MKIHLFCLIVLLELFQSVVPAQIKVDKQNAEETAPCTQFLMPVIKPTFRDSKLVIKPDPKIDSAMVVNPCETGMWQVPKFLSPVIPDTETKACEPLMTTTLNGVTWSCFGVRDTNSVQQINLFGVPK